MKTRKSLTSVKASKAVSVSCFIVYLVAYITRNTYPASIVHLTSANLLSQSQAGLISTCYFVTYGAGHLINGFLADRISPVFMLITGICGTAAANVTMTLVMPNAPVMTAVWCLNGWFESMLWAPIVAILSGMIAPSMRRKAMQAISSSRCIGMITAYLLTALSSYFNFGTAIPYIIAAVCALLTCVLLSVVIKRSFSADDVVEVGLPVKKENKEKQSRPILKLLAASGAFIFAVPSVFHGMLKDGVNTWVPSFLKDSFHTDESFSTLLAIAIPVAGLAGVAFGNLLLGNKRLHKNHSVIGIIIMLLTAVPTSVLLGAEYMPLFVGVICLCTISLLMESFCHIFSVMMPTEFAVFGKASTVSGIFNSLIYAGSALSTYVFGAVAEHIGWNMTVALWLSLAVVSALLLIMGIKPWNRFLSDPKSYG